MCWSQNNVAGTTCFLLGLSQTNDLTNIDCQFLQRHAKDLDQKPPNGAYNDVTTRLGERPQ